LLPLTTARTVRYPYNHDEADVTDRAALDQAELGHDQRCLRVVVAGGYGRTGALVVAQLAAAGHEVIGLVRREHQLPRLAARGATGVLVDLIEVTSADLASALAGADALVIATGSSYGNTLQEATAIDRDVPITCVDAAVAAAVPHVVLISAHRTDEDFGGEQTLAVVRAKRATDAHLRAQHSLRWTILRPAALSDEEPNGHVHADEQVPLGCPAASRPRRRRRRRPDHQRDQRTVRAHRWSHARPGGRGPPGASVSLGSAPPRAGREGNHGQDPQAPVEDPYAYVQ
jgi:putative NADH-flavin reductase